jgi:hypothetical protein
MKQWKEFKRENLAHEEWQQFDNDIPSAKIYSVRKSIPKGKKQNSEYLIHVYDITFSRLYSTTANTSRMNMGNIVLVVKMKPFYQSTVSMSQCNRCIALFSKCK